MNKLRHYLPAMVALLLTTVAFWNLGAANPWWDEGWTLSVARTWVERGFYGRLLDGQLAPPGLEAAFPTTGLVALSFRLFGVGLWQGRLPIVLCMLAALALLYILALRLYNRPIANITLLLLILTPMHRQLQPLLVGRQVLAEPVMMMFIMAGYCCLWYTLRRSLWFIVPASLCWGCALTTKVQLLPFWMISAICLLAVGIVYSRLDIIRAAIISTVGSFVCWQAILYGQAWLLRGHTLPKAELLGIYDITAIVLIPQIRYNTLYRVVLFGIPSLFGLSCALWELLYKKRGDESITDAIAIQWSMLVLSGSWFFWYALLSVGDERYLFPSVFIGSMFLAASLEKIVTLTDLAAIIYNTGQALRGKVRSWQQVLSVLAVIFSAATIPVTMMTVAQEYLTKSDQSALQVASFFNLYTDEQTRIETYNSELHFLLNRRYHYPPDQIHIELIKRILSGRFDSKIPYDAIEFNPDYIIVGGLPQDWGVYNDLILNNSFYLFKTIGIYSIYKHL